MPDLKPCPNPECGAIGSYLKLCHGDDFKSIRCLRCGLIGSDGPDKDEAARLWNLLPRKGDEWQAHVKQADGTERPFTLADLDAAVDAVSSPQNRPAEHDDRRDRFTLAAMRALYAGGDYSRCFPDGLAVDAVRVADALIEELAKEGDDDE